MVPQRELSASRSVFWSERSGADGPLLVLLHGSAATGAVWEEVVASLPGSQRTLVVDLPGHGRSGALPHYSTGAMAAAVGEVVDLRDPLVVVGHSLGAQVGLAMTDPLFGLNVVTVLAISVKMRWSADEVAKRAERALSPRKVFADRESATQAFAKFSGLATAARPPRAAQLMTGVVEVEGGFALAQDPLHAAVPPLPPDRNRALAAATSATVRAVCGDADPLADSASLAALGPVQVIPGAGHNPHLTHPAEVARIVTELVTLSARSTPGARGTG